VQALLVIGGFEAFQSLIELEEARKTHPAFRIPILQVAATISNNVPGTEFSLGCDTALNMIVGACDILKQSATASRKRLFVIESMGGYCGYLATAGALAGGADSAYIFERPFKLEDLQNDVRHLVRKFSDGNVQRALVIRNESCSLNYTTEFMTQMLAEEGDEYFIARNIVLGHLQQGDQPSPFDRILGAKYASHAVDYLMGQLEKSTTESGSVVTADPCSVCVLGLIGLDCLTTPVTSLKAVTDMKKRIPNDQWWLHLYPLVRVLSRHVELDFTDEPVRKGPLDSFQTKPVVLPSDINGRRRHWLHPLLTFSAAVIALIVYMKYN
jgi:6-phosphofructokinase 1